MKECGGIETSIAENIRSYRKQRGLTQEQLAEVLVEYAVSAMPNFDGQQRPCLGTIIG